jgi:predicted ester cyclase
MPEQTNAKSPGVPADEYNTANKGDISRIMNPGARTQALKGFDDDYADIVDYILRCTHKIWEEKGMGLIYTHYQHNSVVHSGYSTTYDSEAVVNGSLLSLNAFPDRRIYADDVIWAGDDQIGFHTSHRITTSGRNTGHSAYGPPTRRKATWRALAYCFVRENRIVEEWLLRDEIHLLYQLGLNAHELAEKYARRVIAQGGWRPDQVMGDTDRRIGQLPPADWPTSAEKASDGTFDIEQFIRRAYHEIWNQRLLNKIRAYHAETHRAHISAGREIYGVGDLVAFIISVLVMFPDAHIVVEHVYWNGNEHDGYRVAVRWTLHGTHDGPGVYGEPTGARVRVMGLSQHHVRGGKMHEEWTIFDEFGLLKYLALARLDA